MVDKTIRGLSNKDLLYYKNRDRAEREHPEKHTRFVTARSFWGNKGMKEINQEIQRRKEAGKLRSSAGKPKRKSNSIFGGGLSGFGLSSKRKKNNLWGW